MSKNQIANINELSIYLNATTSSQNQLLDYTPENVVIDNFGEGVLFIKAVVEEDETGEIAVPSVGDDGTWAVIGPGKTTTYKWAGDFTFKRLAYIATVAGDFNVKLTRGI